MLEILEKITKGQATMEDLDKLEELCYHLQSNSLCALGQTAPNPVDVYKRQDVYCVRVNFGFCCICRKRILKSALIGDRK